MRLRVFVLALTAGASGVAVGCGGDPDDVTATSLQSVENCMTDKGLGANDVRTRYVTEPAFKTGLDECAQGAGISAKGVLDVQRDMELANTRNLKQVAACMKGRGHPMDVEVLADGSANFGELNRYFAPDTLDEFFDDFAVCNEDQRDAFPTEAEMEEARRTKGAT